jgi:DNA-binding LytR/AlgR family response regulator
MTYRRNLLDIRVVVRPSLRADHRVGALRRRVAGDIPMHTAPAHPVATATMPSRTPLRLDSEGQDSLPAPASDVAGAGERPEVVLVKSGFRHVAVRVREIVFVEAARNYVQLHLESGAVLKSRVPIERLAAHLGSERFLRIHRGRLVARERIRSVAPLPGGRLRMTLVDGATIVVARDRRRTVLAELGALSHRRS